MQRIYTELDRIRDKAENLASLNRLDFEILEQCIIKAQEITRQVQEETAAFTRETNKKMELLYKENRELKHDIDRNAEHYESKLQMQEAQLKDMRTHCEDAFNRADRAENLAFKQMEFLLQYKKRLEEEF